MIIEHFLAILLSITATFSSVSLSSLVNPYLSLDQLIH